MARTEGDYRRSGARSSYCFTRAIDQRSDRAPRILLDQLRRRTPGA